MKWVTGAPKNPFYSRGTYERFLARDPLPSCDKDIDHYEEKYCSVAVCSIQNHLIDKSTCRVQDDTIKRTLHHVAIVEDRPPPPVVGCPPFGLLKEGLVVRDAVGKSLVLWLLAVVGLAPRRTADGFPRERDAGGGGATTTTTVPLHSDRAVAALRR